MGKDFFATATPEEVGIRSEYLINFLKVLESEDLPMHSAILMRHGKVAMETYYKPYTRSSLHRMFSITKSFVSLAIGLLEEEGKLSLDDKIVSFFREKLPPEGVHPYLAMMTIRDMLRMSSCHDKTTFKTLAIDDWVKTFFVVTPNHVPGTAFSYDTSSTHTLAALVEKLSGMELLDYLRVKFLNKLDFSHEAYCMKDPIGVSMGGSGLMATPYDLLKVMYVISNGGTYNGEQLLPISYLNQATRKQIDTYSKMSVIEEMQGYGYQFWCTRNNGIVMYGMGGQLVLWLPDKDIILVTTADAQGRQGGVQLIYEAFWNEVYCKIDGAADSNTPHPNACIDMDERFCSFCNSRNIMNLDGLDSSPLAHKINGKTYELDDDSMGFSNISLHLHPQNEASLSCGELCYTNKTGSHALQFGIGYNIIQQFPHYDYKTAVSGTWKSEDTFLIKAQVIDECIGNVFIQLVFKGDYITAFFRKVEETMFNEFNGVVSGKMI